NEKRNFPPSDHWNRTPVRMEGHKTGLDERVINRRVQDCFKKGSEDPAFDIHPAALPGSLREHQPRLAETECHNPFRPSSIADCIGDLEELIAGPASGGEKHDHARFSARASARPR